MKMRALNHVNLVVSDVDEAARYYQETFGMELAFREGDFVFLSCGTSDLALVKGQPLIHRRFHFGFRVDTREEVDAWLARLRERGAEIVHGPQDYGGYYTFSTLDPDSYAIEIYFESGPRGRAGDVTAMLADS
ncbi:MAG: VOC family protein [Myxococcales bacterium]|nr:VOC family protein [Myxococcales bacterium]